MGDLTALGGDKKMDQTPPQILYGGELYFNHFTFIGLATNTAWLAPWGASGAREDEAGVVSRWIINI